MFLYATHRENDSIVHDHSNLQSLTRIVPSHTIALVLRCCPVPSFVAKDRSFCSSGGCPQSSLTIYLGSYQRNLVQSRSGLGVPYYASQASQPSITHVKGKKKSFVMYSNCIRHNPLVVGLYASGAGHCGMLLDCRREEARWLDRKGVRLLCIGDDH